MTAGALAVLLAATMASVGDVPAVHRSDYPVARCVKRPRRPMGRVAPA